MTENRLIQRILVPTDGSNTAIKAAGYAAEIARYTDAAVTILNAAEVSEVTQFVNYAVEATPDMGEELRETGEVVLDRTRAPFVEADVEVHMKIIEGPAADVIIREAYDGGYDLVIMGSVGVGTGAIRRIVFGLGSVAERVLANSPCPVMVVRRTT